MKKLMFATLIFSIAVSFIFTDAMATTIYLKPATYNTPPSFEEEEHELVLKPGYTYRLVPVDYTPFLEQEKIRPGDDAPLFGVAVYQKLKGTDSRKDSWRVSKNYRPPRKIRRSGYPDAYKKAPPPPALRFPGESELSDSSLETENSSDEEYWETNKTWVEPVYEEIQVPGYYNKRGQWIEGYSQTQVVKEGYWDEKKVWTYY